MFLDTRETSGSKKTSLLTFLFSMFVCVEKEEMEEKFGVKVKKLEVGLGGKHDS